MSGDERTTFRIRVNPGISARWLAGTIELQSLRILAGAMGIELRWRYVVEIDEDKELMRKLLDQVLAFFRSRKCGECSKQLGTTEYCESCLKFRADAQTYSA